MHQPWASLVALGVKTIETRPGPHPSTMYGGKIAVHANKTTDWLHLLNDEPFKSALESLARTGLPLGCVIATVEIVKSVGLTEESVATVRRNKPDELPLGNFTEGRFGWLLRKPILLREPIPFRAHQGWPDIDDELIPEYAR